MNLSMTLKIPWEQRQATVNVPIINWSTFLDNSVGPKASQQKRM